MIFRFLLILIIIITVNSVKPSNRCGSIKFPRKFFLRGQWEAYWHEEVYITPRANTDDDDNLEYGIFKSKCMSFNGDVELKDSDGNVVGYTDKQTTFEWGTEINIHDCTGKKIWIVDEDGTQVIVNGANPFKSIFGIYEVNKNGEKSTQIGFSDKKEFLDTTFTIRNMNGDIIAVAENSKFDIDIGDTTWSIQTFGDITDSQSLIISYIVALKEVQDQLDDTDYNYDTCTQWAIGGIVVSVIVVIILISVAIWYFFLN